ncbi:MAG: hypothetical protein B6U86_01675 [Candidatus Altiarchaeales archaeon ex4484_43]|nr:MAG: hypothetical protein B6U86_01675 [Candidatus Altiarchaeales archaeon ex4484_43]RLB77440.1 MAG: hypothetical protein DRH24_16225 [Deltaproteobacteria bacterium]
MIKVKKKRRTRVKKARVKKKRIRGIRHATEILSDVPSEKCFWAHNGWIIRNLQEVPIALENMSDETFIYHVNRDKNDFARWINDVIGDKVLAKSIENVKKKDTMIAKIKKRIAQLKG